MENVERLAFGTLPFGDTVVYTVPRQSRVVLSSIHLVNQSSGPAEVNIWVTVEDLTLRIAPVSAIIEAGDMILLETSLAVEANEDIIIGSNSTNAVVYYISGQKVAAMPVPTDRAQ